MRSIQFVTVMREHLTNIYQNGKLFTLKHGNYAQLSSTLVNNRAECAENVHSKYAGEAHLPRISLLTQYIHVRPGIAGQGDYASKRQTQSPIRIVKLFDSGIQQRLQPLKNQRHDNPLILLGVGHINNCIIIKRLKRIHATLQDYSRIIFIVLASNLQQYLVHRAIKVFPNQLQQSCA
jgi:hypothetical protein